MMAKQIISSLTGLFLFVACIDQTALSAKLERPIGQSSNAQPKPRPTATPVKIAPNSDAKSEKIGSVETQLLLQQNALATIADVLGNIERIEPISLRVSVQVEAANALWKEDKAQAVGILKKAIGTVRQLKEEAGKSGQNSRTAEKIYFALLRRIANLAPELIEELTMIGTDKLNADVAAPDRSVEARALTSMAIDLAVNDPKQAGRLAEQALNYGVAYWVNFLNYLSEKDTHEAERLATLFIDKVVASNVTPIHLLNFQNFVLKPDRSPRLQEYYLSSTARKVRQSITPEVTLAQMNANMVVTRRLYEVVAAAGDSQLLRQYEFLLKELTDWYAIKSMPVTPEKPDRIQDMATLAPASAGDSTPLKELVSAVSSINDANHWDQEYLRLAAEAATRNDRNLAEDIILKIKSPKVRREASVAVYSPLVRKALQESDWVFAKQCAQSILDPMVRTFAMERIAREMLRKPETKGLAVGIYSLAGQWLLNDEQDANVGQAHLFILQSLSKYSLTEVAEEIRLNVIRVDALANTGQLFEYLPLSRSANSWFPTKLVNAKPYLNLLSNDEKLEIEGLTDAAFSELAKKDATAALDYASDFSHYGLRALARVVVCKNIIGQLRKPIRLPAPNKKGD